MKRIINIVKLLFNPKETPKLLGRWNIDYCSKKMNHKIDLSNEDHCGPCGQYAISKTNPTPILNGKLQHTKEVDTTKTSQ
jgi:hypothetical protein